MSVKIDIKRGNNVIVATIFPNNTSNQQKKIMGDNVIVLSFDTDAMVNFNIGDYCTVYGEQYFMSKVPAVKKLSNFLYQYDVTMYSYEYILSDSLYLFLGDDNSLKETEFSLVGNADTFIDLMLLNANRIGLGWTKGGVVQTSYVNMNFSNVNCLEALAQIAKQFNTEYYLQGEKIHLARQQKNTKYIFKYGKNKGLYDITRTQTDTKVVTRLYAYGGTNNIPNDYRNFSQRLLLPMLRDPHTITNLTVNVSTVTDLAGLHSSTYVLNWSAPTNTPSEYRVYYKIHASPFWQLIKTVTTSPATFTLTAGNYDFYVVSVIAGALYPSAVVNVNRTIDLPLLTIPTPLYIEENTATYGVIEGILTRDDIYPQRTGTVTAVDATTPYVFSDNAIDFDVNLQLMPGLVGKVTFATGQLTGYTFEISKFDYRTKKYTILKNKDEKTLDIPSFDIRMMIGDTYVLTDIRMPQSYIDNAEQRLLSAAKDYLDTNSIPQYNYTVTCDPKHFRANQIKIDVGDVVRLIDIEFQVDKQIRVISLTKNLIDEYNYTLVLGDLPSQNTIAQLQQGQASTGAAVQNVATTVANNPMLAGTCIGDFTITQGTVKAKDIPIAVDTSFMKHIFIDKDGKIWREG